MWVIQKYIYFKITNIIYIYRASLHVSFPDSRPFGRLGQTYDPFRITSLLCLTPEVRSFPYSTMLDEIDKPSRLDLSDGQINPVKSLGFLTYVVNHAWCLSDGLDSWCLSNKLDTLCLSDELDAWYLSDGLDAWCLSDGLNVWCLSDKLDTIYT